MTVTGFRGFREFRFLGRPHRQIGSTGQQIANSGHTYKLTLQFRDRTFRSDNITQSSPKFSWFSVPNQSGIIFIIDKPNVWRINAENNGKFTVPQWEPISFLTFKWNNNKSQKNDKLITSLQPYSGSGRGKREECVHCGLQWDDYIQSYSAHLACRASTMFSSSLVVADFDLPSSATMLER